MSSRLGSASWFACCDIAAVACIAAVCVQQWRCLLEQLKVQHTAWVALFAAQCMSVAACSQCLPSSACVGQSAASASAVPRCLVVKPLTGRFSALLCRNLANAVNRRSAGSDGCLRIRGLQVAPAAAEAAAGYPQQRRCCCWQRQRCRPQPQWPSRPC